MADDVDHFLEKAVTVPLGPGKGDQRSPEEALKSLASEMRGHVRDLRDSREEIQAELLERYSAALDLILEQGLPSHISGVGVSESLQKLAKKHHLSC